MQDVSQRRGYRPHMLLLCVCVCVSGCFCLHVRRLEEHQSSFFLSDNGTTSKWWATNVFYCCNAHRNVILHHMMSHDVIYSVLCEDCGRFLYIIQREAAVQYRVKPLEGGRGMCSPLFHGGRSRFNVFYANLKVNIFI